MHIYTHTLMNSVSLVNTNVKILNKILNDKRKMAASRMARRKGV